MFVAQGAPCAPQIRGTAMAKDTTACKITTPPPPKPPRRRGSTEDLVERLLNARNSNEIAAVAGLPPIIGLSGPKIAY